MPDLIINNIKNYFYGNTIITLDFYVKKLLINTYIFS